MDNTSLRSILLEIMCLTFHAVQEMNKTMPVVFNRRNKKQPKINVGSDEEFLKFLINYCKIKHYNELERGPRRMADEDIALYTRIMEEEDKYFAENP